MKDKIIKGQEAICPDGLGRVKDFDPYFPAKWIIVSTYFDNRECKWNTSNVELIDPRKE